MFNHLRIKYYYLRKRGYSKKAMREVYLADLIDLIKEWLPRFGIALLEIAAIGIFLFGLAFIGALL